MIIEVKQTRKLSALGSSPEVTINW